MKPFIILALRRTGTKMLADAISSHPDIPRVVHEFRGDEEDFKKSPAVLSNNYHEWMDKYLLIHLYRENAIAGARSLCMMSYLFPDGIVNLPAKEVLEMAKWRRAEDKRFSEVSDYSISYEALTGGRDVRSLSRSISAELCNLIGVSPRILTTKIKKSVPIILKNEKEIQCLA